jgi:hypothetical protein
MKSNRFLMLGALCLGLLGFPSAASAQFWGFGRVANSRFSGNISVASKSLRLPGHPPRVNVTPAFRAAMAQKVVPKLIEVMKSELPKHRSSGFGPYYISMRSPASLSEEMFVGTDGLGFTIRYRSRGYTATVGLTTPDVLGIGLPRSANPVFKVPMDIELTVDVNTSTLQFGNTTGMGVDIQNVKVKIHAGRPQGANLSGKVLSVANDVVHFLVGPDYLGKAQSQINGQEVNIGAPFQQTLKTLVPAFIARQLAGRQVNIEPVYDAARQSLRLELHKATRGPVLH